MTPEPNRSENPNRFPAATGYTRPWALPLVFCARCRPWRPQVERLALELSCARAGVAFVVLRHGGRVADAWRVLYSGTSLAEAEARFRQLYRAMRQGGLVLVAGALTVRAHSAPLHRTRW